MNTGFDPQRPSAHESTSKEDVSNAKSKDPAKVKLDRLAKMLTAAESALGAPLAASPAPKEASKPPQNVKPQPGKPIPAAVDAMAAATGTVQHKDAAQVKQKEAHKPNPMDEWRSKLESSVTTDAVKRFNFPSSIETDPPAMPGWKPFVTDAAEGLKLGIKTTIAAIFDKHLREPHRVQGGTQVKMAEAFPNDKFPLVLPVNAAGKPSSYNLTTELSTAQGGKPTNEDASFSIQVDSFEVSGVFDGHQGDKVAKTASALFKSNFKKYIDHTKGNVVLALQLLSHEIAKSLKDEEGGCFFAVRCIDKKTGLMYAATLGPCEVAVYRKCSGQTKAIPVSYSMDWFNHDERQRAAAAGGKMERANPTNYSTVNVDAVFPIGNNTETVLTHSRGLGDKASASIKGQAMILTEPTITVYPIHKGDVVLVNTKGLKDIPGRDAAIIKHIDANKPKLAATLTAQAAAANSGNVTVIASRVG